MCLIAIAHRAFAQFPLVIAANRDEDYDRPSTPVGPWDDEPHVVGGRDALHGGSWLAITRSGRFAAVTNLHAVPRLEHHRSRGSLVRDFVTSHETPLDYARSIDVDAYGGFHLLVGEAGGELVQLSGGLQVLDPGVHSLSNAPPGQRWPKMEAAEAFVRGWKSGAEPLIEFLATREKNIFVASDRYGTRSSAVIIVSGDEILFAEQTYLRGGVPAKRHSLAFPRVGPGGSSTRSSLTTS